MSDPTREPLHCAGCNGLDYLGRDCRGRDAVTRGEHDAALAALSTTPAPLDAAWAEAEAAVAEGWLLREVGWWPDEWHADAAPTPPNRHVPGHFGSRHGSMWLGKRGTGPTPAAALLALAEKLREYAKP